MARLDLNAHYAAQAQTLDAEQSGAPDAALSALRRRFGRLHLSRILQTEAVHIDDDARPFLNVVVAFEDGSSPDALKAWFNELERQHGRDRTDPARSRKARPLDLDIVFSIEPGQTELPAALVPAEPYARPFVLDLADHLGLACALEAPDLPTGTTLEVDGAPVGARPMTLEAA